MDLNTLKALANWFNSHICFISIGKYWKGMYIHFLPKYHWRIYFDRRWKLHIDKRKKWLIKI